MSKDLEVGKSLMCVHVAWGGGERQVKYTVFR